MSEGGRMARAGYRLSNRFVRKGQVVYNRGIIRERLPLLPHAYAVVWENLKNHL